MPPDGFNNFHFRNLKCVASIQYLLKQERSTLYRNKQIIHKTGEAASWSLVLNKKLSTAVPLMLRPVRNIAIHLHKFLGSPWDGSFAGAPYATLDQKPWPYPN